MCESKEGGGAIGTVLIESERVRVTRWDFPQPVDCTGWHHYVVVPCSMVPRGLMPSGTTSTLTTGGSYSVKLVSNMMSATAIISAGFIEVELLESKPKG